MTNPGTIAAKTLRDIDEEVSGDSPVLAAALSGQPDPAGPGYSDLFSRAASVGGDTAADYRQAIEYIYEGYLLHYGVSRIFDFAQPDSALLAGDYMYARGLNLVTARGDLLSIRLLSELIDFCALVHCEGLDPALAADAWTVTTLKVAAAASGTPDDNNDNGLPRRAEEAPRFKAELTAEIDRLLAAVPAGQAAGLRDELCNIYSRFNQQRRQDGTG